MLSCGNSKQTEYQRLYNLGANSFINADKYHNNAENTYDISMDYSIKGDYNNSLNNLKQAREYYTESTKKYREGKAYFLEAKVSATEEKKEKLDLLADMADAAINANLNMYEAAEYYDEAIKQNIVGNYDISDEQINISNQRIASHDNWTIVYNDYRAKAVVWGLVK